MKASSIRRPKAGRGGGRSYRPTRGELRELESAVSKEVGGRAPKVALLIAFLALAALVLSEYAFPPGS